MIFIKALIYKLLNKQISHIYNKRFDNYNNTPKGVFWNSKLSHDLRLNIILDKILKIAKDEEFSIADIGCGYGRLYEVIKERNLDGKVQYYGFDINQKLINFCKNNKNFEHVEFAISAFPFKNTDYVVMSGTYNLTPTNNISLWEDYLIKNLTSNWKLVKKAMIFNCLIKEKKEINKALYYTELSWMKRICENNFGKIQILKNQLLKDDITIVIKKSI
jgi:SAM-dependent methyltransferase